MPRVARNLIDNSYYHVITKTVLTYRIAKSKRL